MTNAYKILIGKLEGRRPRHRWEDNIKMDVEVQCEDVDWIYVTQDRYSSGQGIY
jgi:hypothetical protein